MTVSDWRKAFKQLKAKPVKMQRYIKHNSPKKRTTGKTLKPCKRCGNYKGHVSQCGLDLCRQCFREIAPKLGFKKFS